MSLFHTFDKWKERFNVFSQKKSLLSQIHNPNSIKESLIDNSIGFLISFIAFFSFFGLISGFSEIMRVFYFSFFMCFTPTFGMIFFAIIEKKNKKNYYDIEKVMKKTDIYEVNDFLRYREQLLKDLTEEELVLIIKNLLQVAHSQKLHQNDSLKLLNDVTKIKRAWLDKNYDDMLLNLLESYHVTEKYHNIEYTDMYEFDKRHHLLMDEVSEDEIEIGATLR